jgi:hypothetical protein
MSCRRHGLLWNLPRISDGSSITFALTVILILRVIIKIRFLTLLGLTILPKLWQVLTGLQQDLDEIVEHWFIAVIDKGGGETLVANACGTTWEILVMKVRKRAELHTNTVDVLVHAVVLDVWAVIVDDVHDVTDVETTSRDTSSDHDGRLASAECTPGNGQQG